MRIAPKSAHRSTDRSNRGAFGAIRRAAYASTSRVLTIVYKINCIDCDQVYIGQTKRHLETRIKEHRNNINNSSGNYSLVTNHRLTEKHDFKWDEPIILHKEKNRRRREIAEMFFIKKYKKTNNSLNLQKDTENLNPIYDKLII